MSWVETCSVSDGFAGAFPLLLLLGVYVGVARIDGVVAIPLRAIFLAFIPFSIAYASHSCSDMPYATFGMYLSLAITFVLFVALLLEFLDHGKNTILLVGAPGAGKTVFTYGLIDEYRRDRSSSFSDGTDSDYRVLFQEMESAWATGKAHKATDDFNSNRINFSVGFPKIPGEKQIVIYDFGGEQIRGVSAIDRLQSINEALYGNMTLNIGELMGGKSLKQIHREEISHIVFLIGPDVLGNYPDPAAMSSLQSNIDLILKLTMRTGKARRDKRYTNELKKYYHRFRAIKIHCFLTKCSRQHRDDAVAKPRMYCLTSPRSWFASLKTQKAWLNM